MIDWHTHVWEDSHLSDEYRQTLGSRTGRSVDATPDAHARSTSTAAGVVVIGTKWLRLGADVPNQFIAEHVRRLGSKARGFACIDPQDEDAVDQLKYAIGTLGLHGLKLSPVYQGFHPWHRRAWDLYRAANKLDIPVMFHQAAAFHPQAVLEVGNPILLDRVARELPSLRMILAHFGQPWISETVQLLRKHKQVYTDMSARYYRPWQARTCILNAIDYGVVGQVLFGSDFPMQSSSDAASDFRALTGSAGSLPAIPEGVVEDILYNRPFETLGL